MNVLIVLGHPRRNSFCGALADAYLRGAEKAGVCVRFADVGSMKFEKNVEIPNPEEQHLEPDLLNVRRDILWADHLVFVFPTWWGSMPGILKSFFDRVITPGFAFNERRKWEYEKLLQGRTAQVITTMDTPVFVYKYFYKAPGVHLIVNSTLKFCGVSPVRVKLISPIKYSTEQQKQKWLREAEKLGLSLKSGVRNPFEKTMNKVGPWLKALRLQFYPMTFIAYAMGAYAAKYFGFGFDFWVMICGYLFLFVLEAATVFSNEYYDFETDIKNKNFGPFNGGSRVLVENAIKPQVLKKVMVGCLVSLIPIFWLLTYLSNATFIASFSICLLTTILALGYTIPPLKFSWRSLGEIDVAITHSIAVILCGFIFQGGDDLSAPVLLMSIPLLLSIVPAIILSGIPDYDADKAAGKTTIAVKVGKNNAAVISMVFVLSATVSAVLLKLSGPLPAIFGNAIFLTIPHALFLSYLIVRFVKRKQKPDRIDGLMVVALLYILWFGLIPLIKLI